MKATTWLRVAAVLTLVHAVLHTIGGVFGKPDPGAAAAAYAAMTANHFPALGQTRSYAEFYRGMGLAVTIFLTAESVVLWLLAGLVRTSGARLRPVLATFAVAYVAMAVNSQMYFFAAPVITELLIAACLVGAVVTAPKAAEA